MRGGALHPKDGPFLPPPPNSDIRLIERLWLLTACTYELFDEETMLDAYWDKFALGLQERREEWTPYFRACLPSEDYNVGTTACGVLWERNTVAHEVYKTCAEFYGVDPLGLLG